MSGVKGKSGKRPYISDQDRIILLRYSLAHWFKFMKDPQVPKAVKFNACTELIKRQVPAVTEEIGNVAKTIIFNVTKNHLPTTNGQPEVGDGRVQPLLHAEANDRVGDDQSA
jgi:hypothetical protein